MKFLIFALLLSPSVFAVKLVKQQSSPLGNHSQGFDVTSKNATYVRTSNAFDTKNDFRIGQLSTSEKVTAEKTKLEEILKKITIVDKYLKKEEGTSFNEVAGAPGHRVVFMIDGKQIPPESKYYTEVEAIFTQLKNLEWNLDKGYEVSSDLSKVSEFENGKIKRTVDYTKDSFCDRGTKICTYTGGGSLIIPTL